MRNDIPIFQRRDWVMRLILLNVTLCRNNEASGQEGFCKDDTTTSPLYLTVSNPSLLRRSGCQHLIIPGKSIGCRVRPLDKFLHSACKGYAFFYHLLPIEHPPLVTC